MQAAYARASVHGVPLRYLPSVQVTRCCGRSSTMHDVPVSQMPPNYGLEVKPRVAAHEDAANNSLFVCYPFITRPHQKCTILTTLSEVFHVHPHRRRYLKQTLVWVWVGRFFRMEFTAYICLIKAIK
jgi:hypothetical protein